MMKKTLIMASLLAFALSASVFAAEPPSVTASEVKAKPACNCQRPPKGPDFKKRSAEFEQRLKLTDEQKAKAKELREKSFEQMKPIMDKLKDKQAEAQVLSKDASEASKVKLEQVRKEIKALRQEAHRLRMQNMKDFEAILTSKQLKELKKMKEEGRKNFDKEFKKHPRPEFGHRPPCKDCPLPENIEAK